MLVALLTDFGTGDGFVGAVKGVILSVNPEVRIVDISHEVEPFNILEGALILKAHYRYFPEGTVFLAVVDPGVGSERRPLALRCGVHFFVGPDNGIFDLAVEDIGEDPEAVLIENEKFTLPRVNNTFHGRDIFAPVAAYITRGVPLKEFGRSVSYERRLKFPRVTAEGKKVVGEIVYFDRFGNGITSIPCGDYSYGVFRGEKIKVVPYFQAGEKGKLSLTCGSFGFMELFVPMENAKERFRLRKGEEVVVWRP
ncbi:MAG: S-adenosyl-l-methionine hydroxide adenosyltransferase family protein [Aquificota bacterium]|nr:S-adenosyl-l-methionine hydroxide adenosyltransferase family protein [Aquificota bacterium]